MSQTLHIFKKDVRYLRMDILVILALMALFAYADSHSSPILDDRHRVFNQTSDLLSILLPLSWLYLIARLIHAEPLVGDRQFWLTRPYSRATLLAAKALFVVAIISVPKAITDAIIVTARGLPLSQSLSGFLWRELLIAVVMLLPFAALSSVTGSLTQLATTAFVVVAASIGLGEITNGANLEWGSLEWIRDTFSCLIFVTAAALITLFQYRRRPAASLAIGIAAIVLFVVPIPWALGFAIQSRLSKVPIGDGIKITLDRTRQSHAGPTRLGGSGLLIPIAIAGIPDGAEIRDVRIDMVESGIVNRLLPGAAGVIHGPDGYWIEIPVEGQFDRSARGPVSMQASLFLTMFGNAQSTTIPVGEPPSAVAGLGNCFVQGPRPGVSPKFYTAVCASAFRWPRRLISIDVDGATSDYRDRPYSPFPAGAGISPVTSFADQVVVWRDRPDGMPDQSPAARTARITIAEPLAHFRRQFGVSLPVAAAPATAGDGWSR